MGKIYRNNVIVTAIHTKRGKQFGFGIIQEEQPRVAFFPCWVIRAYELAELDVGCLLDCLFVDQAEDKNPMIVALLDEEDKLEASQVVGEHVGRPGTRDFSATVNTINRRGAPPRSKCQFCDKTIDATPGSIHECPEFGRRMQ